MDYWLRIAIENPFWLKIYKRSKTLYIMILNKKGNSIYAL